MNKVQYQHIFVMLREEIKRTDSVEWVTFKYMKQDVEVMIANGMKSYVHEQMQSFYEEYLWRTIESFNAWSFIDFVAHRDDYFGEWATGKVDLMKLTEAWIERSDSRTLLSLLTRLGQTGYETNWQELRSLLDEKLRRMEVEGTRNGMKETGYFYCLLHAFTMIMMSEHSIEEKMRLLELFSQQWAFLRTVYSVMVRRIVGLNYTNFAQLSQYVVGGQQDFDPYLHLFYAPLKERYEELIELGTKSESLDKAMQKIEKRMQQSTPCHDMDCLCETLFPEEFCDMLNRHRPMSYCELECELSKVTASATATIKTLEKRVEDMAKKYAELVEKSITVEQIETELTSLPTILSLPIWSHLNTLLAHHAEWLRQTGIIRDKILTKQVQEMQLNMSITAQPGSNVNGIVQQQNNNGLTPDRQITVA
ncbi:MAG: hypothetical protein IKZ61_02750 [Prevotella sp.]|nr:hypothetical protein [Prevotella sp.]